MNLPDQIISSLAPLRLPLRGSHLIEASAGTGKTYTIAMLYVRLVLGHGGQHDESAGALTPPEILVVTFTEAATQELRERIRARLAEAARCFREEAETGMLAAQPDLLRQLRAEYAPAAWPACARKLELAAEWMDEAAISTIHGWCNRMLREHAFDSQSDFKQKLETEQDELRAEVARDYWRNFYYPLTLEESRQVMACWRTPAELERAAKPLLDHVALLPAAEAPAVVIGQMAAERRQRLQELKQPWAAWVDELRQIFDEARAGGSINGQKLKANHYANWLDELAAWAADPASQTPKLGKGWERLTPVGIAEAWKNGQPPAHPAFAAIVRLQQALGGLPEPRAALLQHAAHWMADEFERVQQRRALIGFDDLLRGLDKALRGPRGERLAAVIRRQFPVALIDEFQDTDPVQYRIFDRIYAIAQNRQDCALILIGDPKQAIYAFRGADVYTYLKARAAVAGRLYTLGTNFRSTRAMVEAVNHCFGRVEQAAGAGPGAFLFRRTDDAGNLDNPLPFLTVAAQGREDDFQVADQPLPALQLAVASAASDAAGDSKDACIKRLAEICATQVVAWLNQGAAGRAGFAGRDAAAPLRALRPGDIAILVNNRNEAASIRQALARRTVRSVYLSDRETVFATPQALEVYRWLAACAEPDDANLLRVALSTPSLGLDFAGLDALNQDEQAWEARVVQFKAYRELWQRSGVLPMLRRILFDFGCGERLLGQDAQDVQDEQSGERRMTDILHLAEILQQASATLEGEHALLRFLAERLAAPEGEQEGRRLRLESDADLVQVVTIHKSKGLEYPLVFLPFICAARAVKNTDVPLKWHDDRGELQLALQADAVVLQRAERERLAEDVRKLYVALTRARYLTWLGLASIKGNAPSAIGHLFGLNGAPGLTTAQYLQRSQEIAATAPSGSLQVLDAPHSDMTHFSAPARPARTAAACRLQRAVREYWWIGSYSALRIDGHAEPAGMALGALDDTPQADNLLESLREIPPAVMPERRPAAPMHGFFKGPDAGSFLHELLEWVAHAGFGTVLAQQNEQNQQNELRDMIARRCQVRGWDAWIEPLLDWLRQLLTTPLPLGASAAASLRLDGLRSVRAEMEFWLPARHVDLSRLDALVIRQTLGGRPRPALGAQSLNGMLKGYMDLLFEHEGRYYVADYKSNWLGEGDEHYTAANMDEAIRAHRYDLQYVIYLFALHRLLRSRLPDYDYERHVGGALYLFVRGIGAATAGVHFERPPATLMTALDALFDGGSEVAA
ncbi:DNA helicase/exodeoxyribonuclease V, beta subunit [Sterolibacterium denitrificans]|uniref:RecBCD enzyme subunit RecB n=1 Tax=Sterolibacterium denitrificans TaxID=157592 RepID=A0A7Z7HS69_9PROT|nr:exodeoxyribonuclease V subunit beta [Sterolibacterium denitrificans]SMB24441.1 DNA helicase/exodeoxyribonuclease V, beta subunit [Sterolibacterium denitrificans]